MQYIKNQGIRKVAHPHNTPSLHPKTLNNLCLWFVLGVKVVPRETEDNAYANFWGKTKMYRGSCTNGELQNK